MVVPVLLVLLLVLLPVLLLLLPLLLPLLPPLLPLLLLSSLLLRKVLYCFFICDFLTLYGGLWKVSVDILYGGFIAFCHINCGKVSVRSFSAVSSLSRRVQWKVSVRRFSAVSSPLPLLHGKCRLSVSMFLAVSSHSLLV